MIGLAAAMLALFATGVPARAQPAAGPPWMPSITVEGSGEVRAKPDMATTTVGVVDQAATAGEALQANNQKSEALLRTLQESGVREQDLQTTGLSVAPNYSYDRSGKAPPRIVGYTVSNQVTAKVRDLASLGELLDKVVQAGANQIQGVSFSASDPEKYLEEARLKAVHDAQRRAASYAKALGATLKLPPMLREQNAAGPQPVFFAREALAAGAAAAVPVAPGQQIFTARVVLTYRIGE